MNKKFFTIGLPLAILMIPTLSSADGGSSSLRPTGNLSLQPRLGSHLKQISPAEVGLFGAYGKRDVGLHFDGSHTIYTLGGNGYFRGYDLEGSFLPLTLEANVELGSNHNSTRLSGLALMGGRMELPGVDAAQGSLLNLSYETVNDKNFQRNGTTLDIIDASGITAGNLNGHLFDVGARVRASVHTGEMTVLDEQASGNQRTLMGEIALGYMIPNSDIRAVIHGGNEYTYTNHGAMSVKKTTIGIGANNVAQISDLPLNIDLSYV